MHQYYKYTQMDAVVNNQNVGPTNMGLDAHSIVNILTSGYIV